jgi:hypothetical protein
MIRNALWFLVCLYVAFLFLLVIVTGGNWALYAGIVCGTLLVVNRRRYNRVTTSARIMRALAIFVRQ